MKPANKNLSHHIQNNIFIENELNAISKMPDSLAQRAFDLVEKTAEHRMQIDKEIIELERQEQKNRASHTRWFYALQGLGAITAFVFIVGSLGIFAFLVIEDKPNAWLSLLPAIITSVIKLGNIKKD